MERSNNVMADTHFWQSYMGNGWVLHQCAGAKHFAGLLSPRDLFTLHCPAYKSSQLTRQTLSPKTAMTALLSPVYRTLATNLLVAPGDQL